MAIQIAIVAASILAVVLHRIKQPSLVAYIAAGLLLGFLTRPLMGEASKSLEHISSLGLILLLFVIGLELDLKKVLGLGKAPAAEAPAEAAAKGAAKWKCTVCGYIYEGEALPEDFKCPVCGVGPDKFEKAE